MRAEFSAVVSEGPDTTLIILKGEADLTAMKGIQLAAARAVSGNKPIVADLSAVTFIDSSGVRALLLAKQMAWGCGLPFRAVISGRIARALELYGVVDELGGATEGGSPGVSRGGRGG
jgi:anti-anti-sigma regulatory factor